MFSPSFWHDLLSGKQRGFAAACFRAATRCLEIPVRWYVDRRNRAFETGRYPIHRVASKVISVGNLTVGGTGKTPLVEWLAQWLLMQAKQPVFISRGYGARRKQANDEALELAWQLPDVPHLQHPRRVVAAQQAVAHYPGSVLVLDDAFQHRWLHRDVDIVLLDALEPYGYEHLLPRGLLREPAEQLKRAQVVILSRANLISTSQRTAIQSRVAKLAPQAIWAEAIHRPRCLLNSERASAEIGMLAGKRIAAFCGIGNPIGFRRTVEALPCELIHWREFADHHAYHSQDYQSLAAEMRAQNCELALCTRKDLVKIAQSKIGEIPLWAVNIGLEFIAGEAEVIRCLRERIA
jgi:tetraacyldisaccharide 4'-kinase